MSPDTFRPPVVTSGMFHVGLEHILKDVGDPPPWIWMQHLHPEDLIAVGKAQLEATTALVKIQIEQLKIRQLYLDKVTQIVNRGM